MNQGLPGNFTELRRGTDKSTGDYTEYIYEGTEAFITNLYIIAGGSGNLYASVVQSQRGAKHTLTLRENRGPFDDGSGEKPLDNVRMTVNRLSKDIFEPPSISGLTAQELKEVRDAIEDNNASIAELVLGWSNAQIDLYNLALAGVKYRPVNQPVIERTKTASHAFTFPNPYTNVDTVLSPQQMLEDAALAGLIKFEIPGGTIALAAGFRYGLKSAP